jgi:arylsulfatase A-like enzyme
LDIFPTVLKLAGASLPNDRIIDGKDFMPLLKQQVQYSPNEFMFHYCAKAIHAVRYRPRHGTTTWKAHFMTPKWTEGTQACFGFAVCGCYGNDVNTHDPPLLYDITNDPAEMNPIDPSDQQYKDVINHIASAVSQHQKEMKPVPSQLDISFWRPWLQSCCNYPYCKCSENVTTLSHFPSKE